jgi:hypothetical protein
MKRTACAGIAVLFLCAFTLSLAACGSKNSEVADAGDTSGDADKLDPCTLLSEQQVRGVVPDLETSFVAHAGASLIEGVDAYQCSYIDKSAAGLTVILNVAADDARFEKIKMSPDFYSDGEKVDIGDAAWVHGKEGHRKVTVYKGHTVIDLELSTPDAQQKSSELTELARAVAAKVT